MFSDQYIEFFYKNQNTIYGPNDVERAKVFGYKVSRIDDYGNVDKEDKYSLEMSKAMLGDKGVDNSSLSDTLRALKGKFTTFLHYQNKFYPANTIDHNKILIGEEFIDITSGTKYNVPRTIVGEIPPKWKDQREGFYQAMIENNVGIIEYVAQSKSDDGLLYKVGDNKIVDGLELRVVDEISIGSYGMKALVIQLGDKEEYMYQIVNPNDSIIQPSNDMNGTILNIVYMQLFAEIFLPKDKIIGTFCQFGSERSPFADAVRTMLMRALSINLESLNWVSVLEKTAAIYPQYMATMCVSPVQDIRNDNKKTELFNGNMDKYSALFQRIKVVLSAKNPDEISTYDKKKVFFAKVMEELKEQVMPEAPMFNIYEERNKEPAKEKKYNQHNIGKTLFIIVPVTMLVSFVSYMMLEKQLQKTFLESVGAKIVFSISITLLAAGIIFLAGRMVDNDMEKGA